MCFLLYVTAVDLRAPRDGKSDVMKLYQNHMLAREHHPAYGWLISEAKECRQKLQRENPDLLARLRSAQAGDNPVG
jgi:hypothetical protein